MSSRKRKHWKAAIGTRFDDVQDQSNMFTVSERDISPGPGLYVQAYEADIVRGARAAISAASLEVPSLSGGHKTGGALIKWGNQMQPAFPQDEDIIDTEASDDHNAVWVDRYDARLLLNALPPLRPSEETQDVPDSPGGWSDLPSDNEDVFFLSMEEVEDFRRDKKRRHIEHAREERVKARRAEDGESSAEEEQPWGGSDEEAGSYHICTKPDDTQRDLMQRTATHLMSSPNPTQLEARIFANHGSDARFAFLRGRWSNTWQIMKGKARMALAKEKEKEKESTGGLSGLAGYGDSDADSDDEGEVNDEDKVEPRPAVPEVALVPATDTDAAMERRRARAKEWAEKRRRSLKEK
ncbi:hypothetical protein C0991_010006 [Blastosporella zonata]|nr:hypothetical protein C0991_010006 [Blastosporella zonata]